MGFTGNLIFRSSVVMVEADQRFPIPRTALSVLQP